MSTETNLVETARTPAAKEAPVAFRAIIGTKLGMTQLFDASGFLRAVSVVKAGPCVVARVRTPAKDGYSAVCLGLGEIEAKKLTKPMAGQFAKSGIAPVKYLREFRVADSGGFETGQSVSPSARFQTGDYVDVQGITKGRGFAGAMKRHGFHGLPGGHGASDKERSPGSLASRRSLGRVIPGQRMAGHYGQTTMTIAKLEVVKIDGDTLYLNGSVPGTNGTLVSVLETTKPRKRKIVVAPKVADKKAAKAKPAAAAKK